MKLKNHVVHLDEVPSKEVKGPENTDFQARRQGVGALIHTEKLGCGLITVPPQRAAWPFHAHFANEELAFILEGQGVLRFGEESMPIRAGHFISFPADGKTGHQIFNNSKKPLRYIMISTMQHPDVVVYPDSSKLGFIAGRAPGGSQVEGEKVAFFSEESKVDYFLNEKHVPGLTGSVSRVEEEDET
ncbi:MAG: cupin domain-containing protein [Acidobacteria bacterium]|nr:cupin domain-containing protein [Acidobacteriota bacterium]